jgi:hypothetical protein
MHSLDFHAHHSPLGAYATFTCGKLGSGGGLTIAGHAPVDHELVVGWVDGDGVSHVLPFSAAGGIDLSNFGASSSPTADSKGRVPVARGLQRHYGAGSDTWAAEGLEFSIHTPVWDLPDPAHGEASLQEALVPVVGMSLRFDNRQGTKPVHLIFAIRPRTTCIVQEWRQGQRMVSWQRQFALAGVTPGAEVWTHWDEREYAAERRDHQLGGLAGVSIDVAAGAQGQLDLIAAFHQAGIVTSGREGRYWYTRALPSLASVVAAGVQRFPHLVARARAMDAELAATPLDEHQRFLVAHAQRSYWGSTQLLDMGGDPVWIVYEGEYAMMNTFDLTVDQLFYEMRRNPWTVRNVLDQFVERYSFRDRLNRPAPDAAERSHRETFCRDMHKLHQLVPEPVERGLPGGVSFCHDMGIHGNFSAPGTSSYEVSHLSGCFSHMTCEQLLNWICTATTYAKQTGDEAWLRQRSGLLTECLESLLNRDDPVPSKRNGVNSLDSDRCAGGWEITTYDSLDHSLGQARNNLYMAVKGWAAYLGLEWCLGRLGRLKDQVNAADAARRAAETIVKRFDPALGYIPAVFEGGNRSAIIPAIEGLVFPLVWGMDGALDRQGPFADLLDALDRHHRAIIKPGVCLFQDSGWKLSSTADNSWLSKIFICQHVAERVLNQPAAPASHSAHAQWQQIGSAGWAFCDQCINGVGAASRYYPRCVTNDLWLLPR